jgi:hypothetical protein
MSFSQSFYKNQRYTSGPRTLYPVFIIARRMEQEREMNKRYDACRRMDRDTSPHWRLWIATRNYPQFME